MVRVEECRICGVLCNDPIDQVCGDCMNND
jgi:hypothetical protein